MRYGMSSQVVRSQDKNTQVLCRPNLAAGIVPTDMHRLLGRSSSESIVQHTYPYTNPDYFTFRVPLRIALIMDK
jgi:hypothetical protein